MVGYPCLVVCARLRPRNWMCAFGGVWVLVFVAFRACKCARVYVYIFCLCFAHPCVCACLGAGVVGAGMCVRVCMSAHGLVTRCGVLCMDSCACPCMCIYVACVRVWLCIRLYACMRTCLCVMVCVCACGCLIFVCVFLCFARLLYLWTCMSVCSHVSACVCFFVCMRSLVGACVWYVLRVSVCM